MLCSEKHGRLCLSHTSFQAAVKDPFLKEQTFPISELETKINQVFKKIYKAVLAAWIRT
jgi:hypothetical protein